MFDSLMRQLAAVVSKGKQCAICDNKSALVFASLFVEMSAHKSETSEALSRSRHEMTVVICTRCARRQGVTTVSTPLFEPILEQVQLGSGSTKKVDMTELYMQQPLDRVSKLGYPTNLDTSPVYWCNGCSTERVEEEGRLCPKCHANRTWVCPHCGEANFYRVKKCKRCKAVNS